MRARMILICGVLLGSGGCDDDSEPAETGSTGQMASTSGTTDPETTSTTSTGTSTTATSTTTTTSNPSTTTDPSTTSGSSTTGDPTVDPPDTESSDTSTGEPVDQVPPTDGAALLTWLEAGSYADWNAEPSIHDSAGPHFGDVRVFANDDLADALSGGSQDHPVGAASVKELYGDGPTVRGWAVSVKTAAGSSGDNWYWYEVYDGTVYSDANGDNTCVPCHSSGVDFFRSTSF